MSPRLVFNASAGPSTVVGPNATTTVTGSFTTDSFGAAVSGANLSAFDGLSVGFTDPQPSPATVSSPAATFATDTGSASVTYNSQTSSGPGHVLVGFDNASVTVPITVNRAPAVTTEPANQSVNAGDTATFTAAASGYPTPTVQWQVSTNGGSSFSNIGGATSTTLLVHRRGRATTATSTAPCSPTRSARATTTAATLTVGSAAGVHQRRRTATFMVGTAGHVHRSPPPACPTVTSISETGTLPTGLTFTDNGDGTATIAGTPAAGTGGTYPSRSRRPTASPRRHRRT